MHIFNSLMHIFNSSSRTYLTDSIHVTEGKLEVRMKCVLEHSSAWMKTPAYATQFDV
jgi:hypothetical protein